MRTKPREVVTGISLLSEDDVYLFGEGNHFRLYEKLGSHPMTVKGRSGTLFAVWAPNAQSVSVVGDFNSWDSTAHPLAVRWDRSGIWEGFLPEVGPGHLYKFHIISGHGIELTKSDPFAFHGECPPNSASIVRETTHQWRDQKWMKERELRCGDDAPWAVYELHIGSWRRVAEEGFRSLSYREMAVQVVDYVCEMGFTHVELLPVTEHPFFGSWGYQTTGYFAPTSRYGTPQDFMHFVDELHRAGIGVILDWVPSHFPCDDYALGLFDGTHLYEHADPRKGFHPDWNSYIFNYGRHEVVAFLVSSALFWLDKYHIDGLRVDAVASMLYLDYSRQEGEWVPNRHGGRENLEAVEFLHRLNAAIHNHYPEVRTIAEESTSWPRVSYPLSQGGLGFDMKWKMGWMHDTLEYCSQDPLFRRFHHDKFTFSMWYAHSEKFLLPLSHDEVVHGKGSLYTKMPGDPQQKLAQLRLLFGHMYSHPGKKLLFMGGELGQPAEWNHDGQLDWELLDSSAHRSLQLWVRDLNLFYRSQPALHELDFVPEGFEWIEADDREASVFAYLRRGTEDGQCCLVVCNFTPVTRKGYRLGLPDARVWQEALNSDAARYGGTDVVNPEIETPQKKTWHSREHSLRLDLPPLGIVFLTPRLE